MHELRWLWGGTLLSGLLAAGAAEHHSNTALAFEKHLSKCCLTGALAEVEACQRGEAAHLLQPSVAEHGAALQDKAQQSRW